MRVAVEVEASGPALTGLVEGLVRLNLAIMATHPLPPLYGSGVVYKREPAGSERWQSCDQVFKTRSGDCEDLCAWRVAELRRAGESEAIAVVTKVGPRLWHVRVVRANGDIEDPSRILGMGKNRRG